MVPSQLHVKSDYGKRHKNHQRDHLLYHFQLHQRERSAITLKTHPVGGHLQTVFKEGNSPR